VVDPLAYEFIAIKDALAYHIGIMFQVTGETLYVRLARVFSIKIFSVIQYLQVMGVDQLLIGVLNRKTKYGLIEEKRL
jgi:hypothetical protein